MLPMFRRSTNGKQPSVLLMIDLEGGVLDAEALLDELLELAADGVAVVPGADEDVRGEGGEAGSDRPDVEVVDV
ncbi:MAG: hypothetical protein ACRDL4_21680, partial [Thermoleophilaceae bacterium]